jgi:hypothetical protein
MNPSFSPQSLQLFCSLADRGYTRTGVLDVWMEENELPKKIIIILNYFQRFLLVLQWKFERIKH